MDLGRALAQAGSADIPRIATGGIIALSGNAGGSGKSLLAANLAALLGIVCERRVVLVDLDLINASLHDTLGLVVPPGAGLDALHTAATPLVREAVRHATAGRPRLDTGQEDPLARLAAREAVTTLDLSPYLIRYPHGNPFGPRIDVLTGVTSMAAADRVAGVGDTLDALIHLLRARYDDVIMDLGTDTTNAIHEGLAARADLLLVVTWPTPDGIERVATHHARMVRATGLDLARCRLVINHVPSDATAMIPPMQIVARMSEAGPIQSAGIIAQDVDLVGRARLADPDQPLVPVLLPDRAARRSRFVCGLEDLVAHVRPDVLPRRETTAEMLMRRLTGWFAGERGPQLVNRLRPLFPATGRRATGDEDAGDRVMNRRAEEA